MTSYVHGAKILNLSRPVGLDYTVHPNALADYICFLASCFAAGTQISCYVLSSASSHLRGD